MPRAFYKQKNDLLTKQLSLQVQQTINSGSDGISNPSMQILSAIYVNDSETCVASASLIH